MPCNGFFFPSVHTATEICFGTWQLPRLLSRQSKVFSYLHWQWNGCGKFFMESGSTLKLFFFKLGTKNYNLFCCCCSLRPQNTVENISERPNTIWSNFRLSPLFYSAKNPYIFNFFRQCISLILFCHR